MPDISGTKISALDADNSISDSDYLAGVDAGSSPVKTKRFTLSALKTFFQSGLTKSSVGLGNVDNVLQYSASNKPTPADLGAQTAIDSGTLTLSLSWSGSGPYTQTVTVTGAVVTANSMITFQPTAAQLAQLISDGVQAITIENNAGVLTAYALGAAPTTSMTIACTVTEVSA